MTQLTRAIALVAAVLAVTLRALPAVAQGVTTAALTGVVRDADRKSVV